MTQRQRLCLNIDNSFKMKRFILIIFALSWLLSSVEASAQGIFLETENFPVKGGWQVDQQFMDLMGSPYLIAHGMGKPVEDASTTVDIPEAGVYHVWVRSYNWTSPWTEANGPGAFRVKIQGKPMKGMASRPERLQMISSLTTRRNI